MLIDWFTVAAQTANFLILMWLLKRYLYGPILHAVEAREKRIADELTSATQKTAEAQAERDAYAQKSALFDAQRATLMEQAASDASEERRRRFDEIQKEMDELHARQQKSLESELQNIGDEIARQTQQQVFAIAQKALQELAGIELETHMAAVFASSLKTLALDMSPQDCITVRSAYELSPLQRAAILDAIHSQLVTSRVEFELSTGLICGIELVMQGHKFSWSLADYLTVLETHVAALLRHESARHED